MISRLSILAYSTGKPTRKLPSAEIASGTMPPKVSEYWASVKRPGDACPS